MQSGVIGRDFARENSRHRKTEEIKALGLNRKGLSELAGRKKPDGTLALLGMWPKHLGLASLRGARILRKSHWPSLDSGSRGCDYRQYDASICSLGNTASARLFMMFNV